MSYNGVMMTNPRLDDCTIINYLSSNSSLTDKQIRECFKVYAEMLKGLVESNYFNTDLTIALPSIGKFYFAKKAGRRKGSTYCAFHGTTKQMLVQENDKPDYYMLKFRPYNRIKKVIRKNTEIAKDE